MRKLALVVLTAALVLPAAAHATFPGQNGKIAFVRSGDIWTMDPDGTGQVNLTNSPQIETTPAWSPDGTKIAFNIGASGGYWYGSVYTMNADGSSRQLLGVGDTDDWSPKWSPDGKRIAYGSNEGQPSISVNNADGTNRNRFTFVDGQLLRLDWSPDGSKVVFTADCAPGEDVGSYMGTVEATPGGAVTGLTDPNRCADGSAPYYDLNPSWSPDMQRIVFDRSLRDPGTGTDGIHTIRPDGSGLTHVSGAGAEPVWSPDGQKIAFMRFAGSGWQVATMSPDGTGAVDIAGADFDPPDWQPLPINAYPRPKGATPMRISLVTANDQCTAPNRSHGAPLAFPSCAPFQLSSNRLTVGTGDSNGKDAFMQAFIRLDVGGGDVHVRAFLNDIFNKDLSDYTGGLRASLPVQVTDKHNTPSPFPTGAATTAAFPLEFDLGCTATPADITKGSDCALDTTLDTLVPGAVSAGKRAIWELGQAKVYDGGTDGDPATTLDNTLFAVEGLFIP